ncbi:protein FAR1-RELATED SEQUENCE 7-like [Silene latifolia]|uniref:protein FAR1-RELATED SEQUENCE 7-like n=1 Tax=Silene latifolia TaxID=37657 RepID=UPI003D777816
MTVSVHEMDDMQIEVAVNVEFEILVMYLLSLSKQSVSRKGWETEAETEYCKHLAIDKDNNLRRAIWADKTARRNYSVFGDVVSYGPTYSTNKYDMIFTSFTGIDHHKRSVTFCGALIAHKDHESFQWVFNRFLNAMGGKEPQYIITNQDPGIIKAVPLAFKTACHRFCMWHIMNKVPAKFRMTREDYKEFLRKMNDIIWDDNLEEVDFDVRWTEIMEAHGLVNEEWTGGYAEVDGLEVTVVKDSCRERSFNVEYNPGTLAARCTCRMFERKGIICRYIVWILSANGKKTIPDDYVAARWKKDALKFRLSDCDGEQTDANSSVDGKEVEMVKLWLEVHVTIGLLRGMSVTEVDLIFMSNETVDPVQNSFSYDVHGFVQSPRLFPVQVEVHV